jgi:hypothetical protein
MISGHRPWDIVVAVHVSPDGDDFVAITSRGHILHMSGLKTGAGTSVDETASHPLIHLRISATQAQDYLKNLAYDGQRILAYGVGVQIGQRTCYQLNIVRAFRTWAYVYSILKTGPLIRLWYSLEMG